MRGTRRPGIVKVVRLSIWTVLLLVIAALLTMVIRDRDGVPVAPAGRTNQDAPMPTSPSPSPTRTATPTPPKAPTATPTAIPVQVLNGTELRPPSGPSGPGYLIVKNGTTSDAVIKLVRSTDEGVVRSVYVVRQSDWTIRNIGPGTYRLWFAMGNDWDPVVRRFQRNPRYWQFDDAFEFSVDDDGSYTYWEVTLHPVADGTAETSSLDPGRFNRE